MTKGYCFCKDTSWEYSGDENWACYCHCDDCRRNCAAPVVAWLGVPLQNFKWTGVEPQTLESSKGSIDIFAKTAVRPLVLKLIIIQVVCIFMQRVWPIPEISSQVSM